METNFASLRQGGGIFARKWRREFPINKTNYPINQNLNIQAGTFQTKHNKNKKEGLQEALNIYSIAQKISLVNPQF